MQSKGNNEIKSSAQSKYKCQYHVVFTPKYRRQVIYCQIKKDIGEIIRKFWCRGYYVDTVGRNKRVIAEYIRNQLEEDFTNDQMTIKEYVDTFTGAKNK